MWLGKVNRDLGAVWHLPLQIPTIPQWSGTQTSLSNLMLLLVKSFTH